MLIMGFCAISDLTLPPANSLTSALLSSLLSDLGSAVLLVPTALSGHVAHWSSLPFLMQSKHSCLRVFAVTLILIWKCSGAEGCIARSLPCYCHLVGTSFLYKNATFSFASNLSFSMARKNQSSIMHWALT